MVFVLMLTRLLGSSLHQCWLSKKVHNGLKGELVSTLPKPKMTNGIFYTPGMGNAGPGVLLSCRV